MNRIGTRGSAISRFKLQYEVMDDGCWNWNGSLTRDGYGRLLHNGKRTAAHRFSYQLYRCQIPEGLVIDHLCRNRQCVNPFHLEAVTFLENVRRGLFATQLTCKRGHPLDEINTYRHDGVRHCRKCTNFRAYQYRQRRALAFASLSTGE